MGGTGDLERLVGDLVQRDVVRVPPYPAVAMRLQKLVAADGYGGDDVAKLVGEDQALAATLLRYANSAQYRGLKVITSLPEAIGRIGAVEVCRTALALGVGALAATGGPLAELRRKGWRQAYMAAVCSQQLGAKRGLNAAEAFVCGLLHDFGRLFALVAIEHALTSRRDSRELPAAEWEALVDRLHVSLGEAVARRWNLPPVVRSAIAHHHRPQAAAAFQTMVELMAVTDVVVALVEQEPGVDALPDLPPEEMNLLVNLVPQLPAAVAALDEAQAPAVELALAPSQVLRPTPSLRGGTRVAEFSVSVLRAKDPLVGRGRAAAMAGLVFHVGAPLKVNNLVHLRVEAAAGAHDLWVNVVSCAAEGDGFAVEAQLFGADSNARRAWAGFFNTLK